MRLSVAECLCSVGCYLFASISGQLIGPIPQGQAVEEAEERTIDFGLGPGKNFLNFLLILP